MSTQVVRESGPKNHQFQSVTNKSCGLFQRKCSSCSNHTVAGGECNECGKRKRPRLQTKLAVSEPGDIYEQEADRIADQVLAASPHRNISDAPPRIQRFTGQPTGQIEAVPESVVRVLTSPGRPLESGLRQEMEEWFGYDFSTVRVHTDARAAQSAHQMNAYAYTVGQNIVFGAGQFIPGTYNGRRLLVHELSHTIQQGTSFKKLTPSMDDIGVMQAEVGSRIFQTSNKDGDDLVYSHLNKVGESARPDFILQMMRYESRASVNSVTILQELAAGENTAAMRAVVRAINETPLGSAITAHIICSGGGDQFDLTMTSEDAEVMRQVLNDRIQYLSTAARSSSLYGGDPATTAISRDPLTDAFNREFGPILPALRQADRTSSSEEDEIRPREFTTPELREMFSSTTQRRKILDYCNTHTVPHRLFNGDDAGNANAQQRIILSAHILTYGTISAGAFTQRINARFCGHWVELVNNYAGVGRTGGRGIENEFDFEGQLVMGSGGLICEYEGSRIDIDEAERGEGHTHRRFRRSPLPISNFDTIQPGDWLYVFTNTDTAGGNHSVIFSNWLDEAQESAGIHYRKAAIFSQTRVERGGARDEWLLGDRAGRVNDRPVYPITRIARYNTDAHPPRTSEEVEAVELGVRARRSPGIARQNDSYIRRHTPRGHHINRTALNRFLRETNSNLLYQLASMGRAEPGQLMLWQATNESTNLEGLIRLNERLNTLIRGTDTLARAEEAEALRVDPRREAAQVEAERRRGELEPELEQLDADIERFGVAMALDSGIPTMREEQRLERRRRRQIDAHLALARREQRASLLEQRRSSAARNATLELQIEAIEARREAAIQSALQLEGNWRLGRSSHRQHYGRLRARRDRLLSEIQGLEDAGGFRMTHPGREFRSTETMGRLTGLLENADPQPPWSELLE